MKPVAVVIVIKAVAEERTHQTTADSCREETFLEYVYAFNYVLL